jgi:hypothetical protein
MASSTRFRAPSLVIRLARWNLTVLMLSLDPWTGFVLVGPDKVDHGVGGWAWVGRLRLLVCPASPL